MLGLRANSAGLEPGAATIIYLTQGRVQVVEATPGQWSQAEKH